VNNDEDNSIRHYQLDDEVVNFFLAHLVILLLLLLLLFLRGEVMEFVEF